jgi:hypothetical protein
MSSQVELVRRLDALERLVNVPIAFTKAPDETEHNESARILRNGLAVMAFAILEDFARTRAAEQLLVLQSKVTFNALPTKLQEFATVGVIDAVWHRKRYLPATQRVAFVQAHATHVSSTTVAAYSLSPLAALSSEANVGEDTLAGFLKGLGVEAPWDQIASLSARLGFGALDARQAYKDLAQQRNQAAHEAGSNVEHSDLLSSIDAVFCIAATTDMLASTAVRAICNWTPGAAQVKVTSNHVAIRRLDKMVGTTPPRWRESREGVARVLKVHVSENAARQSALARAAQAHESVIQFRSPKRPVFWEVM